MCQSKSDGGKRCAQNVYGIKLRNLQAKKQYHLRAFNETGDVSHKELATTTYEKVDKLKGLKKQIVNHVEDFDMEIPYNASKVIRQLRKDGLQGFIVGGIVRDALLKKESKDIDIEVYGGSPERVAASLKKIGNVDEVGKAFGVLKIKLGNDDFDISLPRKEKKTGDTHKAFSVDVDPEMSLEEATSRRDFTINTLLYDDDLKMIIDCHGGVADIKAKELHHVSDAFDEDPLRVLRGVQMAARFDMTMHPDTITKAISLKEEFGSISKERVQIEFQKMYEKGQDISRGYEVLSQTEWDEKIPGLKEANTEAMRNNLHSMQLSGNYNTLGKEEKVALLAAVVANNVELEKRRDFLSYTTLGDKTKNISYNLTVTSGPADLSDYELKMWAHSIPNNINVRTWATFQEVNDEGYAKEILLKAEALGVADRPETDVVNGNDVMELFPERKPGPWLKEVLNELRSNQYKASSPTKEFLLKSLNKK